MKFGRPLWNTSHLFNAPCIEHFWYNCEQLTVLCKLRVYLFVCLWCSSLVLWVNNECFRIWNKLSLISFVNQRNCRVKRLWLNWCAVKRDDELQWIYSQVVDQKTLQNILLDHLSRCKRFGFMTAISSVHWILFNEAYGTFFNRILQNHYVLQPFSPERHKVKYHVIS